MTAYILRRLLLMIPTFLGILVINFGVLRLQSDSLVEVAQAGSGKGQEGGAPTAGERKVGGASTRYENHIDRFRRTGNDLPALLNLRGFLDKEDMVRELRRTSPDSGLKDSERNQREKALWLLGRYGVHPLADILRDEALADLHGPASQALALCAYTTLDEYEAKRMPVAAVQAIAGRNLVLRSNIIEYGAERGSGFRTTDRFAADKRRALLAVVDAPEAPAEWRVTSGEAWGAVVGHTGFTTFLGKLFTGTLMSETRKEPVFTLIGRSWSVTVWLNVLSIVIAWSLSIPLGIRSARRLGTFEDRATTNTLFFLWSLPTFFIGTVLLHHFCTDRTVDGVLRTAPFPNAGLSSPDALWFGTPRYLLDLVWHGLLPMLVLTYGSFTVLSRYMRGSLLDQLGADYARTARAKGCDEDRVVYRHCLRNSMLIMITLGSGLLAELFGGVLIVEMLFSIPGLGWLLLDAARQNDAPLVMGATVISVSLLLLGILIADICYAIVDPRIRSRYA